MNNLQVQEKIKDLESKIERLNKINDFYSAEVEKFKRELDDLKKIVAPTFSPRIENEKSIDSVEAEAGDFVVEKRSEILGVQDPESQRDLGGAEEKFEKRSDIKSNLEKFIGENLLNKIGIVITVIGVAIGVQYSIEHNLVSPLVRIIIGYVFGMALLFVGLKLKSKYLNYSAVLVSGSAAMMYFITFAAYSFYHLIPVAAAFIIMVLFTALTVFAALKYNRQIIGLLGLVGAYATPFLLSSNSGKVWFLFSYMAIINSGILYIAMRKYWKILYYSAFAITWIIYAGWFLGRYNVDSDLWIAFFFSSIFFLLFYATFVIYKLLKGEKFDLFDIIYLLSNSFIYFGFGFAALEGNLYYSDFQGLFTIINASVHAIVAISFYKRKDPDINLIYLISGLAITFLVIAIPVQFDGDIVTLFWISISSVLFWISRKQQVDFYEILAYPLTALSFFNLLNSWSDSYNAVNTIFFIPVFNSAFLVNLIFTLNIGLASYLIIKFPLRFNVFKVSDLNKVLRFVYPILLVLMTYLIFLLEIAHFWDMQINGSVFNESGFDIDNTKFVSNINLYPFKILWMINYSAGFIFLVLLLTFSKLKNFLFSAISLSTSGIFILIFLFAGLLNISRIIDEYLQPKVSVDFALGFEAVILRYVSLAFISVLVIYSYLVFKGLFQTKVMKALADSIVNVLLLIGLSNELSTIFKYLDIHTISRYELTALWGIYSLSLISYGIWKKAKHLRILALGFFGVTLAKLFVFDIASLSTLPKTLIFVSLGLLLLVASFLYQKFKAVIFGDDENLE